MSHRDFLGSWKGKLAAAGVFVLFVAAAGFLVSNPTQGSIVGTDQLSFKPCSLSTEYDIQSCEVNEEALLREDQVNNGELFWATIETVNYGGSQVSPMVPYLYENGFKTSDDRRGDRGMNDVNSSSVVLNSLESASACTLTADLAPQSRGKVTTTEASIWFRDDSDDFKSASDRYIGRMMSDTEIEAAEIRVGSRYVYCSFNASELMEKGVNMEGSFISYRGNLLTWEEADISVDLEVNSDNDPVLDAADSCPEESGLAGNNGCPNNAPVVASVSGPRNVTVGESVNYTAEVQDQDEDSLEISWSNGDSGKKATYSWNNPDEKTVRVTVDDGFTESTKRIDVRVREKSFLETLFGFFDGLWGILSYGG